MRTISDIEYLTSREINLCIKTIKLNLKLLCVKCKEYKHLDNYKYSKEDDFYFFECVTCF